ncbi:MAG: hypothetical protein EBU90_27070 [Proteobacteria bacterium]|nr:hypothetical protein [Pseudomonadota bacterium]NBP16429.1 hypothetical protein [bacterium]
MNESDKKAYLEYLQKEHNMKPEDALAYFEYAQTAQKQPELSWDEKALAAAAPVLGPLGKAIDVATLGAPIRAGVSKLVEAQTGQEIAPEKKLIRGEAPTFEEIWQAEGFGPGTALSEKLPGMYSPTGEEWLKFKKGGPLDITPRGVLGGVMDIATAPGTSILKPLQQAISKSEMFAKAASKIPSKYSILGALSGVPKEAIETYAKNKSIINALDPIKAAELAEQATIDARKIVSGTRQQLGETLQKTMEEAGNKAADISSFKDTLYKKVIGSVGDLENIQNQQTAKALKSELDSMFQLKRPQTMMGPMGEKIPTGKIETVDVPSQLKATELFDIKNQLKDLGDLYGGKPGIVSAQAAAKAPVANKKVQTSLIDAIKDLDTKIDDLTAGASKEARAAYAEQASKARAIDRYFSTPERAIGTLSNLSSTAKGTSRKAIQEADQLFGTNLENTGKVLESAKYFNEPSIEALSGKGSTSTSRTYGGAAIGSYLGSLIGGAPGAPIGMALGAKAASPAAIRYVYLPSGEVLDKVTGAISKIGESKFVSPITEKVSKVPGQAWLELLRNKQGEEQ